MATLMKICQIQGVIHDLIQILAVEAPLPDFKFDDKNDCASQNDRVHPPTHTGYGELEVQGTFMFL